MGLPSAIRQDLILHLFQNANIANVGDATGVRRDLFGDGFRIVHGGTATSQSAASNRR